ncbi:short-chain dehydrogenase [Pandoraea terrae]|uniref:Short-chain dehydrogenase n=1 Tax=Pandoraea terrae TaxID=1537710 RepID=A0A5E4U454_9BURK|nr:SDR family NAD(P)-dependent oxidoreductase [Pandoraea terrae]VVD94353.1 short-chain dehydrogenase [Pandoraea terrae]
MLSSSFGLPQGATLTAEEVCAGIRLHGKLAVITGASTGLGKETARALALAGAHVFLGGRDEQALMTAKRDISTFSLSTEISVHRLDLMSASSVCAFTKAVESLGRPVDILICNAGIMACPLWRSETGIEAQFMTNYVGHALLTSRLCPLLRSAGRARFVSLSSCAHHLASVDLADLSYRHRAYDRWSAYGQSKTAAALLAVQVYRKLGQDGVTALTVHPGMSKTELGRFLLEEEKAAMAQLTCSVGSTSLWKSAAAGAATSVWAATAAEFEGVGPAYLEDCAVAPLITQPNFQYGVMPYALDETLAQDLWHATEQLLGTTLPL